jgi:hypothetical protein
LRVTALIVGPLPPEPGATIILLRILRAGKIADRGPEVAPDWLLVKLFLYLESQLYRHFPA